MKKWEGRLYMVFCPRNSDIEKPLYRCAFRDERALTLLEIIIVIALLGSLMVYLVSNLTSVGDAAKEDQARLAMGGIAQALQMYRVHNNRYPTVDQGLDALLRNPGSARTWRGPYIEADKLNDPWGSPFSYEIDGRNFRIISPGFDGVVGNEDDISYPDQQGAAEPE